jgi:hypothetical protein
MLYIPYVGACQNQCLEHHVEFSYLLIELIKNIKKKKKYHTVETFLKSNGKNHRKWQNQHHYHTNTRLLTFQSW